MGKTRKEGAVLILMDVVFCLERHGVTVAVGRGKYSHHLGARDWNSSPCSAINPE